MLPSNDYTSENVSVRVSVTFPIIGTCEYSSLVGNTYFSVRYEVLSPVCQGCSNITTRWSQNVIIRQQTLSSQVLFRGMVCRGRVLQRFFYLIFHTEISTHEIFTHNTLFRSYERWFFHNTSQKWSKVFRKWSLPFSQHLQIQLQAFLIYTEIGQHLKMLKFRHFRNVIDTGIINKTSKVWSQRVPFNIEQLSFHQAF